jgi:hypothetical protein
MGERTRRASIVVIGVTALVVGSVGLAIWQASRDGSSAAHTGGLPASSSAEPASCPQDVPFAPSYLPEGFDEDPEFGPASGAPPPEEPGDRPGQVVIHYTDGTARSVEVRRPGTLYVELALADDAPTITVLGAQVNDVYPVSPGGSDLIVQFRYPLTVASSDACALWSLNGYGLGPGELRKIAEGLVPAS